MTDIIDIEKWKKTLEEFSHVRDWSQYHNPKNLSMALACESGELLEIFRWMTEPQSLAAHQDPTLKEQVSRELADVILNVIRIADFMQINLNSALEHKIKINNRKYPAELVKGCAKKYNEYYDEIDTD